MTSSVRSWPSVARSRRRRLRSSLLVLVLGGILLALRLFVLRLLQPSPPPQPPPPDAHALERQQRVHGHAFPRVLHQTWLTSSVPRGLARSICSWRELQPGWQYAFHDDAQNDALVSSAYAWLLPVYSSLSAVGRADVARLLYMHAYGGVYADLDMTLLRPLDPLLRRHRRASVLIGQERE